MRPPVRIVAADTSAIVIDKDQAVRTRDGTVLRVNVHRPRGEDVVPVILCAHPYGKDRLPRRGRRGHWRVPAQYRLMRQGEPFAHSELTSWEAPDPAWWVPQGFAVVNCDLRGSGASGGVGSLMSDEEGRDIADLVEWAGAQRWSSGSVALLGVSYLALSQWKAAANRPPSLKAIVPWEGLTDAYRDLVFPGGVREEGFVVIWSLGLRRNRLAYSLLTESRRRPLVDDFWRSLAPDVEKIDVPVLVCGSFSDNNLHSRGSIAGFERVDSVERHLYTHRGGKWSTFYGEAARRAQLQFLDRHLRGRGDVVQPPVRLEVRDRRDHVVEVRDESSWPLERTSWTRRYLSPEGLAEQPPGVRCNASFSLRRGGLCVGWTVPHDVELTGSMAVRLFVELSGTDDADLVVGVEKWLGDEYIAFEGSYGYGRDRVATGWQNVALRRLDEPRSRPFDPVASCDVREPVAPGEIVEVAVALGPSSTLFHAGEQVRLVIAGRWLSPRNPITGQFPARYRTARRGECTIHFGPEHPSRLLLPVIRSDPL
ncbi:MAG: CocE/NonD family hydrolase [Microthrixaceae bacterium]